LLLITAVQTDKNYSGGTQKQFTKIS